MSTQQVITVAFAAAGFAIGGPTGAQVGAMIGSVVGGMVDPTNVQGPRLGDLSVQSSAEGAPIALAFGAVRIAGNVLQCSEKRERAHRESAKGGPTTTTFTYSVDVAVGLCVGPIVGVRRIWANNKLIYDATATASAANIVASGKAASGVAVYLGTEDQLPDPTLEAMTGIGSTPAYRGMAYIVFSGLQLADFGNVVPNFQCEVIASGTQVPYRRLVAATLPQQWRTSYAPGIGTPTIYSIDTGIIRVGVSGGLGGTTYLYDFDGNFLGLEARQPAEAQWPIAQYGSYPNIFWGVGRLWDGTPLYYAYYYRRIIGAQQTLITGSEYQIHKDASGGLPVGRQLLSCCLSSNGRYIFSITAPAGSTAGSGTGDCWHITEWTGEHAELVSEGTIDNPVYEYIFGPGSIPQSNSAGMMEDDLSHIWNVYGAGTGDVTVYEIGSDGVLRKAKVFRQYPDGDGLEPHVFTFPSCYVSAGVCVSITGNGLCVHTRLPALDPTPVPLSGIVTALCKRAGLTDAQIDASALTETCHGYTVANAGTARSAIEPLRQFWPFDVREEDDKLVFVPRGGAQVAQIPWGDLAAHESGSPPEPLPIAMADETELPTVATIVYLAPGADYQVASQHARRTRVITPGQQWPIAPAQNVTRIELPIAMTDAQAARAAATLLWDAFTARKTVTFSVTLAHAGLRVADPVQIISAGASYNLRITRIEESGLVRTISAVFEDSAIYQSAPPPAIREGVTQQSISLAGPTRLALLDIPILRDADNGPGYYAALGQYLPGWPGGSLYTSADAGATWTLVDTVANSATLGTTIGVLGNWSGGNAWDETNSVIVQLPSGLALESLDALSVLNGGNAAVIGDEIVQFRTATLVGVGQYRLSGFLRGRKGTEDAMATHADADRFVLLDGVAGLIRVPGSLADIGKARLFKAVTAGQALEDASQVEWTNNGRGLKPLAPVAIAAGRDASGNVLIQWTRRSRIDADWRDAADAALGEAAELYHVEILSDLGVLLRTLTSTTPAVTYYADDCLADFGSMATSIPVRVYQVSASIGRGLPGSATLSLPAYSRVVDPFFAGMLDTAAGSRWARILCRDGDSMTAVVVGRKLDAGTNKACRRYFKSAGASAGNTWQQIGTDVVWPLDPYVEWQPTFVLAAQSPSDNWLGFGALVTAGVREFVYGTPTALPVSRGADFAATDAPLSISWASSIGRFVVATASGKLYSSTNGAAWTLEGTLPSAGPIYRTGAGWVQLVGLPTAANPTAAAPELHYTSAGTPLTGWSLKLSGVSVTGYPLASFPGEPSISGSVVYLDVWGREFTAGDGATITRTARIYRSADGGATWSADLAASGEFVGVYPDPFVPASRGPVHQIGSVVMRLSPVVVSTMQPNQSLRRYASGDWRIVATSGVPAYNNGSMHANSYAAAITGLVDKPAIRYSTDGIAWRDPIVYLT